MVSSLLLLWVATLAAGETRDRFAQETGLDVDLINVVKLDVGDSELTIVFVFINERTFLSDISERLRQVLLPHVGRNAIYVNPSIQEVLTEFDVEPLDLIAIQDGAVIAPTAGAWIEITSGFMDGRFEVNPSGPSQGSGSEGIVVLEDAIDSARPFQISYRGQAVTFDIGSRPAAVPAADPATGDAVPDVTPLDTITTLEDILTQDEFSDASMAGLFGLDPALVRTIHLSQHGEDLRLFFVRIEEAVRESALGDELLDTLEPFVGTGAVMVWAFTGTGATFSPWHLYVNQGTNWPVGLFSDPFIELTDGFSRSVILEAGQLVAGLFRLPSKVDASQAFAIYYGTSKVTYP